MKLSAPIFRLKRQAKMLARDANIPLNKALDQIATGEGFQNWSHLAVSLADRSPAAAVLAQLQAGDLVLLGARPGHGKTMLGLELAAKTAQKGHLACFFTLEETPAHVAHQLASLGIKLAAIQGAFMLDTGDNICADHVIARMRSMPRGSLAVIDYLQVLDQRRQNAPLADQIQALKAFAQQTGMIILLISQIDRLFEESGNRLPSLADVRLPNPVDLTLFTKTCFLHDGYVALAAVA